MAKFSCTQCHQRFKTAQAAVMHARAIHGVVLHVRDFHGRSGNIDEIASTLEQSKPWPHCEFPPPQQQGMA